MTRTTPSRAIGTERRSSVGYTFTTNEEVCCQITTIYSIFRHAAHGVYAAGRLSRTRTRRRGRAPRKGGKEVMVHQHRRLRDHQKANRLSSLHDVGQEGGRAGRGRGVLVPSGNDAQGSNAGQAAGNRSSQGGLCKEQVLQVHLDRRLWVLAVEIGGSVTDADFGCFTDTCSAHLGKEGRHRPRLYATEARCRNGGSYLILFGRHNELFCHESCDTLVAFLLAVRVSAT